MGFSIRVPAQSAGVDGRDRKLRAMVSARVRSHASIRPSALNGTPRPKPKKQSASSDGAPSPAQKFRIDAWPALMTRELLAGYTSISTHTLAKICPVSPLDIGANCVRFSRTDVDRWLATLSPRSLTKLQGEAAPSESLPVVDEAQAALDRVRARALGRRE